MRILFENYSSPISTEPIYIAPALSKIGVESHLWDTNVHSAFDIVDMFNPDVIVCKHTCKSFKDLAKRINGSNIKLAVNTTGASKEQKEEISTIQNAILLFSNNFLIPEEASNKIKVKEKTLMPAADLFLPMQNLPKFKIEGAVCSCEKSPQVEEAVKDMKTYHKIIVGEKTEDFDFSLNVFNLGSFYERYEKFVIVGNSSFVFSQLFFDAAIRCNRVIAKATDDLSHDALSIIFKHQEEENIEDVKTFIQREINKNHSCIKRTQEFLSYIGATEEARKING
jgi:hypothetical protein